MPKRLPNNVKNLLSKAKDSALLAVEIYNKPRTAFRSGAYITLMIVAWNSLLHAIFERRKISYYYRKGDRRFEYVDGEKKAWDVSKSINYYFANPKDPVRKNIEFFVGLRNRIEHRFMPFLDQETFGECQALLINFEELMVTEFGKQHAISENLVFSLQFSKFDNKQLVKQNAKSREGRALTYVREFRSSLGEEFFADQKFSYRAYLIPKVGNKGDSDVAIEFVKYDPSKPEEMKKYEHLVAFVKEKDKIVQVANQGKYKPTYVASEVSRRTGKPFSLHSHVQSYRKYNIRPANKAQNPMECNVVYCQYDVVHKDYIYTDAWIEFLVSELSK